MDEIRNEIKEWIEDENRDFYTGFQYFVRFSHNRALALYLQRKENMEKLTYELSKIIERPMKDVPVMPIGPIIKKLEANSLLTTTVNNSDDAANPEGEETAAKVLSIIKDGKVRYEDLPESLKLLYNENAEKYKLMRACHEKLKSANSDEERASLRQQIDQFDDVISPNWQIINEWAKTGEIRQNIPKQDNLENDQPEATPDGTKQIIAARSYISRELKKISTLEGIKRTKSLEKIRTRYELLKKSGVGIQDETIEELRKLGIE